MTLESNGTSGDLFGGESTTETPTDAHVDTDRDTIATAPDADDTSTADSDKPTGHEVATRDPQELLKAFHKGQGEIADLKRERDQTQQRLEEIQLALQDPDILEGALNSLRRKQGGDAAPSVDTAALAEQTGFDEPLMQALDLYMESKGYVTRDDPEVRQFRTAVGALTERSTQSEWQALEQKFPGASEFRTKALELARSAGIDLESALHAASKGSLAVQAESSRRQTEVQRKAAAQLPRDDVASAPRTPPQPEERNGAKRELDVGAFARAAKRIQAKTGRAIDLEALFNVKKF